ncbi:Mortality factor 4-like protein 1 [Sesbania bispinosa]|nr:Mortality factor 4-like protein 1 [Sesbania bispinosa]
MGNSSKDDSATSGDASAGDVQPSNSRLYSEGEKVLAYHGPRIYEAKAPLTSRLPLFIYFVPNSFAKCFCCLDLPLLLVYRLEFDNFRNR